MAIFSDWRGPAMTSSSHWDRPQVVAELAQQLSRLGWTPISSLASSAWQPDLTATDSNGTLLSVEVQLGSQPLHSKMIKIISDAQSYLSSAWPGRSVVALLATNPISERLESALSSMGVILIRMASISDLQSAATNLHRILDEEGAGLSADGVEMSLMNQAALAMDGGRLDEARSLYTKILDNQARLLGKTHPIVFETKLRLARLSALMGNLQQALTQYDELLSEQTRVLGADHPSTLTTRRQRADLLTELDQSSRIPGQRVPGYLGRVLDTDGGPVGTCFQVAPGVLITSWHVLDQIGAADVDASLLIEPIAGGDALRARVRRLDAVHDAAVMLTDAGLPASAGADV